MRRLLIVLSAWACVWSTPGLAQSLEAALQAFAARDYVTAMRLMRPLAEAGETSAQTYVAFMYKNGLGVDEDDAEAALWYRKAAEQDDALAQYSLGSMYEKGEGVPQSDVQAHVWYGIAAARFPASDREHIDKAIAGRTRVAVKLKPAQLAEAEKQAREWRPTKSATVLRDCPACPELVVIPAGRFAMGSPAGEPEREGLTESNAEDERPVHDVTIARPFAMGRYEITYGEFAAFAEDMKLAPGEKCWVLGGPGPVFEETAGKYWRDPLFAQAERQPAVCVNWDEAKAYADWLSKRTGQRYRLPTDAEWEYAARGGTTTARYWGDGRDQACAHANVRDVSFSEATGLKDDLFECRDGFAHSAPVGSFKPNAFGLFDMIGNAAEWTADCHAANYRNATTDGTARPDKPGCLRAFRAGGFSNTPSAQRAANRVRSPADSRRSNLGFRVVREVAP